MMKKKNNEKKTNCLSEQIEKKKTETKQKRKEGKIFYHMSQTVLKRPFKVE